jgi:hypothetical protein
MPTPTSYTDEELGLDPTEVAQLDPNIRRELRQARTTQRQLADLLEKQERQERDLTFFRAGIPADEKGSYFAAGYTGELDPVAIKAEYEKIFGSGGEQAPGDDGKTAEELAAQQRIANAGGEVVGVPGTISLEDAIKNAKTTDEVMTILRNAPPEAGLRVTDSE